MPNNSSQFGDSLINRPPTQVREREILRVSAVLAGGDPNEAVKAARNEVLKWAQNRTTGRLPVEAWGHDSFEHLSSGRNCAAVRLTSDKEDIWAARVEDPDKTVPGRIWTSEISVARTVDEPGRFTLRLLVGSPEISLTVEPHVPGVVRQVVNSPGLLAGTIRLTDKFVTVRSDRDRDLLINALLDPSRRLPIIVLSVASHSSDPETPWLDPRTLAKACTGLALVVVLPSQYSWALTERFGKQLSVYEGAARVYLPGFTEDANPFGGHELILPTRSFRPVDPESALTRLRWIAADGSVRRLRLGADVLSFAPLKALGLEQKQRALRKAGATDLERLKAANERIGILEERVREGERYQAQFSDLHAEAEERAEIAETQLKASGFRIQQLLEQIKTSGVTPDANIVLPDGWDTFCDWCDDQLAGRVLLTPQGRRGIRAAEFDDVHLAARCLLWLANDLRESKLNGTGGSLRDRVVEPGIVNAHCGADEFEIEWQGGHCLVDWHIKNGGNTRDPRHCLRIYYFWDESSQQAVIASLPAHRRTDAS
ncbi:MAG: hypothetical protein ACLP6G_05880 [Terriglobales bacterium]